MKRHCDKEPETHKLQAAMLYSLYHHSPIQDPKLITSNNEQEKKKFACVG